MARSQLPSWLAALSRFARHAWEGAQPLPMDSPPGTMCLSFVLISSPLLSQIPEKQTTSFPSMFCCNLLFTALSLISKKGSFNHAVYSWFCDVLTIAGPQASMLVSVRWGGEGVQMPFHLQIFQSALLTCSSLGFLLINKQFEMPRRKQNPPILSNGTRTLFYS